MKLNRITSLLMLSCLPLLADAASYDIVELPTKELSVNQFGSVIDNTGQMLITITRPFNLPIDRSLLDLSRFTFSDPDAAAAGNFNIVDYTLVVSNLLDNTTNNAFIGQKLSSQLVYKTDGNDFSYVNGFDTETDGTDGFTFAQTGRVADAVNGTHIVGTMAGKINQIPYTNAADESVTFTINDFTNRAFVQVGEKVVGLVPDAMRAGGFSSAAAINDNLQVAGTMGISISEGLETAITSCSDPDVRGDIPIEACLFALRTTGQFSSGTARRAVVWQVDANGELIDKTIYGLPFTPSAEITGTLSTQATDINNSGVAVGNTAVEVGSVFSVGAAIFENGVTTRLLDDNDLLPNFASGINNNGYAVGYQSIRVSRTVSTNRLFTVDTNTGESSFTDGFFNRSSTTPRAINNNNVVVGNADSEGGQGQRSQSGFIYDIDANTFTNVNSLVACNSEYDIVALNDINDSGEIIGDAVVRRPARDARGNEVKDGDGNFVLVDVVVAVKLEPTGAPPSECEPSEEEAALAERQGASAGILTVFGLLVISLFRRSKKFA